jgi:hypothetical protein
MLGFPRFRMPSDAEKVVEANQFRLKDARGRTRAILGMSAADGARESAPALTMFETDGVNLLSIALDGDHPQILLSGGEKHIDIGVTGHTRIASG